MPYLQDGTPVDIILNPIGVPGRMNLGQILETHLGWAATRLGFRAVTPVFDGANEVEIAAELARAWLVDRGWDVVTGWAWDWLEEIEYDTESMDDDDEARNFFVSAWLAESDYDIARIATDYTYARHVVASEWLRERGWEPETIIRANLTDLKKSEWEKFNEKAIEVCTREWYAHIYETYGEELGDEFDIEPAKADYNKVAKLAAKLSLETNFPLPVLGKERLIDGKSGHAFDQPVTVGIIHMLKLAHLVEDKVHARSTGPYSLVTQQPLGGKAQFGGQRFGEMEVWALEAYGAAHTLQEMLTVKSDDVQGRVKTYEAIVKSEKIDEPGIPASFRVLVKELQSLGLSIEAVTEAGTTIRFGKEDDKRHRHWVGTGLMDLARNR